MKMCTFFRIFISMIRWVYLRWSENNYSSLYCNLTELMQTNRSRVQQLSNYATRMRSFSCFNVLALQSPAFSYVVGWRKAAGTYYSSSTRVLFRPSCRSLLSINLSFCAETFSSESKFVIQGSRNALPV